MNRIASAMLIMLGVGEAVAQIPIQGHSDHEPPGFAINQERLEVRISDPGTYVFWAKDDATGALGQINEIHVAPAVTGTVIVGVYDWDTGPTAAGAEDVWEVNLSGATDGRLSTFRIAGTYGDAEHGGKMQVLGGETICIGGDVVVPPAVDKAIEIPQLLSGSVTIGGNILSPVSLGVVWGPFTVNGQIAAQLRWTWNGDDVDLTYTGAHPGGISIFSAGSALRSGNYALLCRLSFGRRSYSDARERRPGGKRVARLSESPLPSWT
jgi:hypothetical protein